MASKGGIKGGGGNAMAKKFAAALKLKPKEMRRIGTEMATIVAGRVFAESGPGRDEHNHPFPAYSTKRIYVPKDSPPRPADMPKPHGNTTGKTTAKGFARGKTRKTMKTVRYDGGYSQYRASIGRSSGANVNLYLTGKTARAFNVLSVSENLVVLGFRSGRQKARWLDERYRFMRLTPGERQKWAGLIVAALGRRTKTTA